MREEIRKPVESNGAAELNASRSRRLFELNEWQERRKLKIQSKEAPKATREAEEDLLEGKNELLAQVQVECQMWKDRARKAEETLEKDQTRSKKRRSVLYLQSGW